MSYVDGERFPWAVWGRFLALIQNSGEREGLVHTFGLLGDPLKGTSNVKS